VVVSPIQHVLTSRGAPAWLAKLVLLVTSFGILAVITAALVWSTTQLIGLLTSAEYTAELAAAQDEMAERLDRVGITGDDVQDAITGLDPGAVAGQITAALSSLLSLTSALSLLGFTLLFMVLDAEKFATSLDQVRQIRPAVVGALEHFAQRTRTYFVVSTVFGLIVAVFDVAALMALGIPLALVWGVLSLITNYIPNVGFVIGLIPPASLAFFEGGWQLAVWVIVIYSAINFIIQSVIQPQFVGDAVGLSTTLTFLSLIFWGWVLGPLGALLAVPMTLLAKALLIDIDPSTSWAAPLISLSRNPPVDANAEMPSERQHRDGDGQRSAPGPETANDVAGSERPPIDPAVMEARRSEDLQQN
ncbi:MAG: AI-2E family transporter, partial [Acidimicrobiales bacterium]